MSMPLRKLAPGQSCQIWTYDLATGQNVLIHETAGILLEAPNWAPDGKSLILNGDGKLWQLPLAAPALQEIPLQGIPNLNNDHVLDPDGVHIFLSTNDDWHIYRAPLAGGKAVRVTGQDGPADLLHFLHGVSPDGKQLAFVGVQAAITESSVDFHSAEICTIGTHGTGFAQITQGGAPADGPEYSPDGQWLYFNTEAFSGHAQIARMRPDRSNAERLTNAPTVDWFPHISPDGAKTVYLSYPPGTRGHPADLPVTLNLVQGDWSKPVPVAQLFGGQGTINVNSWAPDSTRLAYIAYPIAGKP